MKKLLAILLTLALLLSLCPMAFAENDTLSENGGYETRFYRDQPQIWNFTPSQTGEYLLFLPGNGSLFGQIVGQTPTDTYDLRSGHTVQVYELTGGTTYQVKIEVHPNWEEDVVFDVFNIDRKHPLTQLTLSESAITCMQEDTFTIYLDTEPYYYPLNGLKWSSSDESILSIVSAEDFSCTFFMKKAGTATITATLEGLSASCTVTVEKAGGYWDNLTVWPADQTELTLSLPAGQGTSFSFTPSQTGTYVLHTEGGFHIGARGTLASHMLNYRKAITMYGDYELVDLIAGETYVIEVGAGVPENGTLTGTAYVELARQASDIIFFGPNLTDASSVSGYVGGMKDLMAISDPVYAYALGGNFTFQSSDPSMAVLDYPSSEGSNCIFLLSAGQCTINVSTGGITKQIPVTVKPAPILEAGKTTTLEFGPYDAYGVTCLFTPEESGNYTFTIKGSGGTCYVADTSIGNFIYGSGSMGGWLQGGKTYQIVLYVGESNHTISVSGGSAAPEYTEPTNLPSGSDTPTEPTESTEPTDPTDSTEPTDPVAPTEPADPGLEDLADAMNGTADGSSIRIATVESAVNLSADHLDQLAGLGGALVVSGKDFEVTFDSNALSAITAAGQENVQLQVQSVAESSLSQAQKESLSGRSAALVLDIQLTAGDVAIHDFAGGSASVAVPFRPEAGKDYSVYYLSQDGTLEAVASSFTKDSLTFTTGHFSQYVALEKDNASADGNDEGDTSEDDRPGVKLLPYLLIAVVLAIGAAVAVIFLKKKQR